MSAGSLLLAPNPKEFERPTVRPASYGALIITFFPLFNRFNSSNEYSMSSQATAWVKK